MLLRWLPQRLSKRHLLPTTVLFWTEIPRTIMLNPLMRSFSTHNPNPGVTVWVKMLAFRPEHPKWDQPPIRTRWIASITFICESPFPRRQDISASLVLLFLHPSEKFARGYDMMPRIQLPYYVLGHRSFSNKIRGILNCTLITPGHLKFHTVRTRTGLNPPHRGQPFPSCSNQLLSCRVTSG